MSVKPLLITAMSLVIWRLLLQINVVAVPGVYLYELLAAFRPPSLIGPNSLPFERISIGEVGIGPYIAALVIISLVRSVSSRLREMSLERWAVGIGVLLSFAQSFGWVTLMQSAGAMPTRVDPALRIVVCLELAGGTAVTIFLAHTIDEHGLGFGYGAFLLFALGAFADQLYRLMEFAYVANIERDFTPLVIWSVAFVAIATAGVTLLLAVRHVSLPAKPNAKAKSAPAELRFLTSGVMRPPQFAFALLTLPALLAPYYLPTSPIWRIAEEMSPYGPNRAVSVAFVLVQFALVVFFGWFVAAYDGALMPVPRHLRDHVWRLGVLSGIALGALVTIGPILDHLVTDRAGILISISAANTLLLVAVVFLILRAIDGHPAVSPLTASPTGIP